MTGKTHFIGGLAVGFATSYVFNFDTTLVNLGLWYGACGLGGLLPDIDHQHAPISKILFPISWAIRKKWSHRTMTHSLIFLFLIPLLLLVFTRNLYIIMGIFTGILSHLIMDMLNPTGVPLFYPINKRKFRVAKVRTGGAYEGATLGLFCLGAYIVAFPTKVYDFIAISISSFLK